MICECSDGNCFEVIQIPPEAYREVRRAGRFLVAPGHARPELEHVLERRDQFDVVEKYDEEPGD